MQRGNLLITGATGAIGTHLLAALLADELFNRIYLLIRPGEQTRETRFETLMDAVNINNKSCHVIPVAGDITDENLTAQDVQVVIHAAADTRFRAPAQDQLRVNVAGTQNLIAWAARLPKLKRFILVSTTCVAGNRTGLIPETYGSDEAGFANQYECTKWQAEQLVRRSGLPSTIVRLSTVVGSERTGSIHRLGALHHALRWMYRGLVPMIPGISQSTVDLISSEMATSCLSRLATQDGPVPDIVHIAAGHQAIPLAELIDFAVEQFRQVSPAWQQGQIARPMIVDGETFDLFRDSICRSGDVLFRHILDSVASFLPGLLQPRIYQTTRAERFLGGPLPHNEWRPLMQRVIHYCLQGKETRIAKEACLA